MTYKYSPLAGRHSLRYGVRGTGSDPPPPPVHADFGQLGPLFLKSFDQNRHFSILFRFGRPAGPFGKTVEHFQKNAKKTCQRCETGKNRPSLISRAEEKKLVALIHLRLCNLLGTRFSDKNLANF